MTDPSSTYELLAISVRKLIDATIRTELEPNAIASTTAEIDAITGRLSAEQIPGSFGERTRADGQNAASGNAVIGVRNPLAPPLVIHEGNGLVWSELVLGAAYEGPAGYVHGGVCAMVLDHVLGATAHKPGRPAYTGTLTLRYHRGTSLRKPLRAEAWVDRVEGVKTFAAGQLSDSDGVTVSAEGVFIHPRE
ncbi:thioesterase [Mycobacterium sp. E3251]|uniref:PaaI family thioesterase n=1 Tax=unclassified Mycobacterium TaxID=2642494 RepID=UPI0008010178|nr:MULTISPECIES: PaaI family thioesterase [unclassified Mycobacterium]OBG96809.1 thioesterase [Mycobacterium sp. E3251]OBI27489.1 thioesterase [Mycobacterium sp. E1386]